MNHEYTFELDELAFEMITRLRSTFDTVVKRLDGYAEIEIVAEVAQGDLLTETPFAVGAAGGDTNDPRKLVPGPEWTYYIKNLTTGEAWRAVPHGHNEGIETYMVERRLEA